MPEQRSPSLAGRALLAVALTVCFYTLAVAIGVGLVAAPIVVWIDTGRTYVWLAAFCIITGLGILWSIVPRPERFEAPGPPIDRERHPDLVAEVERVASDTGHPMPDEMYLAGDLNAAVLEAGPFWNRRRVLILGLPLLQALTVSQVRAVIAHEFAHYIGGDTRFGNWIWRTRSALGRTLLHLQDEESIGKRILSKPFEWYAMLFSRITATVSRRQEFAADALAARVAGSANNKEALRRIHRTAPAHAAFIGQEVEPVLGQGFRPPLAEGFASFVAGEGVRERMDKAFEAELEQKGNPHDSHPTLSERLASIDALGAEDGEEPLDDRSALALVPDVAAEEARALDAMLVGIAPGELKPITWDDVPEKVVRPIFAHAASEGGVQQGATVGDAGQLARRYATEDPGAIFPLAAAVTLTLEREGFTLTARLGEPVRCTRGELVFEPVGDLIAVANEDTPPEDWRARCERAGVAGVEVRYDAADEASAGSVLSSSEAGPSSTA